MPPALPALALKAALPLFFMWPTEAKTLVRLENLYVVRTVRYWLLSALDAYLSWYYLPVTSHVPVL